MSCIPVNALHRLILDLLRDGPRRQTELETTTGRDLTGAVDQLRDWGWVFGDLELSGVGWYHAGFLARGILP